MQWMNMVQGLWWCSTSKGRGGGVVGRGRVCWVVGVESGAVGRSVYILRQTDGQPEAAAEESNHNLGLRKCHSL